MRRSLMLGTFIFVLMFTPAFAGDYAYVLKFSTNEADQVVRFYTGSDEIVKKIEAPDESGWNNFLVDEKGGCFIASYRKDILYGRDIYYYDPQKDKVEHFINLGKIFGPSDMALTDNELIVHVMGYSGDMKQSDGLLFIDRKNKKIIDELYIPLGDYTQANINSMYHDKEKYIVLSSFYMPPRMGDMDERQQVEYTGDIFIINVAERKIIKTIQVPREYKYIYGVCMVGDKIYAAATYKGYRDKLGNCPINNELLVFSLKNGKLTKTIKIDGFPLMLTYDKSVNKFYVSHRNEHVPHSTMEVIDPDTDKIIGRITIPNQLMASIVAPHKMYVSAGKAQFEDRVVPSKLYVVDTRTDKIIKEFNGVYTGISLNSKY